MTNTNTNKLTVLELQTETNKLIQEIQNKVIFIQDSNFHKRFASINLDAHKNIKISNEVVSNLTKLKDIFEKAKIERSIKNANLNITGQLIDKPKTNSLFGFANTNSNDIFLKNYFFIDYNYLINCDQDRFIELLNSVDIFLEQSLLDRILMYNSIINDYKVIIAQADAKLEEQTRLQVSNNSSFLNTTNFDII